MAVSRIATNNMSSPLIVVILLSFFSVIHFSAAIVGFKTGKIDFPLMWHYQGCKYYRDDDSAIERFLFWIVLVVNIILGMFFLSAPVLYIEHLD